MPVKNFVVDVGAIEAMGQGQTGDRPTHDNDLQGRFGFHNCDSLSFLSDEKSAY